MKKTVGRVASLALLAGQLAVTGCSGGKFGSLASAPDTPSAGPEGPDERSRGLSPLFAGQVEASKGVAPVIGGTLLVTQDGRTIVAADPERDSIFLVDSASRQVRLVAQGRAPPPGRMAEGANGRVFVALRRGGALLAIDVANASVARRTAVCAAPRGVAYDERTSAVYVACRSGRLLTLDAGDLSVRRSLDLDTDLRDVIVRDSDLVVTRFLSAEVLVVAADGAVSRRGAPLPEPGCSEATVAFRALALPGGQIALAHQVSSDDIIQEDSGGYGFACGGALVSRVVSTVDVDTPADGSQPVIANNSPLESVGNLAQAGPITFASTILPGAGPLDIAFDAKSERAAVIAFDETLITGQTGKVSVESGDVPKPTLWLSDWDGRSVPDFKSPTGARVAGQPVAIAFDGAGHYVAQSREPATLEFEDGARVSLSAVSRADTGHAMFHMDSGIGIACSSCHPEGGEDGHVWHFSEGLRRTLSLEGGVMERAPFHWDGTLGDMKALVNEVMVKRMSMQAMLSDRQVQTLGSFLESLPASGAVDGLDPAAVSRGAAAFRRADVACASCHIGPQYTDNRLADVGTGGRFVTPSLVGVGLRPALMHDGCAKSVVQRFGPCGGTDHGHAELLSATEREDLITFLRSL